MKLFRSAGEKEYQLIQQSGFKSFPARLPGQPVVCFVLNKQYAAELASKQTAGGLRSYVLEFDADDSYISWFEVKTQDREYRQELCIPSEQMDEFNSHINGQISVIGVYKK